MVFKIRCLDLFIESFGFFISQASYFAWLVSFQEWGVPRASWKIGLPLRNDGRVTKRPMRP